MEVKITNTLLNALSLCYRIPSKQGERANPVLEVSLPPRALLQSVKFPSQEYFEVFKTQNQKLIDNGTIIIGATTAKKAMDANSKNLEAEKEQVKSKIDRNTQQLQNSASSVKAKMKTEVKKDSD